jgi:hypothetical protein
MAYSATPIFYDDVASLISFAVLILSLVVQAVH